MLPFSESCVCLNVIGNPGKKSLSDKDLKDAFGPTSQYRNKIQIIKLDRTAGALLQMENPAGK